MPKIILKTGFSAIVAPSFREGTLKLGQDLQEHVCEVEEEQKDNVVVISGRCIRTTNINDVPYILEITLDPSSRCVRDRHCTCPAGEAGNCRHIAALILKINNERHESCTSTPAAWSKPSVKLKKLYPKGDFVEDLLQIPEEKRRPDLSFAGSAADQDQLAEDLARFGLQESALFKMIQSRSTPHDHDPSSPPLQVVDDDLILHLDSPPKVIISSGSSLSDEFRPFWEKTIEISSVSRVFVNTLGQSLNKMWFKQRQFRISASIAHKINGARRLDTLMKYFYGSESSHPNLQYGRVTEAEAKKKYEEISGTEVMPSGLVVKADQPWLCCSPDGFVKEEEGNFLLLEIKCPVSCQDKPINVPYLKDGLLERKGLGHQYFAQIQVQLYVCDLKYCHLFVYSSADHVLVKIKRDENYL